MGPDEIEGLHRGEVIRIAGVEALMDVEVQAGDAEFLANIGTSPRAAHGIADQAGMEVPQQILDEVAAAIAGVAAVAVLAGTVEVVQAGQVWDRTCISGCKGQPCIDGSVTLLLFEARPGSGGWRRRDWRWLGLSWLVPFVGWLMVEVV